MAFLPIKIPSIPNLQRLTGDTFLTTILQAIKTALDTRFGGLHGQDNTVVLRGELGVPQQQFDIVTDTRMNSGTLQKRTRNIIIINGIITVVADETDWVNA